MSTEPTYPDVTPDRKTYCFFRKHRHALRDVPSPESDPWLAREVFDLEATTTTQRATLMGYLRSVEAIRFVSWERIKEDGNMATLRRWKTTPRGWALLQASGIHDPGFAPLFGQGNDPVCPVEGCDSYGFLNVGRGVLKCKACDAEYHKDAWRKAADEFGGAWA